MSSESSTELPQANIEWVDDKQPLCQRFDDYYFSSDDGLGETRHNFIEPSKLHTRFSQLQPHEPFRLVETGFGTGLNFLACWQVWKESGSQGILDYISIEKYPLNRQQLRKALAQWPELNPLAEELYQSYPSLTVPGWHLIEFANCRLQLYIGDVTEGLNELQKSHHPKFAEQNRFVDSWFLDGFAPAKNPDMWRTEILENIAHLSKNGAVLATFTVVSAVRRQLQSLGFQMQKASGFGLKREMMTGHFLLAPSHLAPTLFLTPSRLNTGQPSAELANNDTAESLEPVEPTAPSPCDWPDSAHNSPYEAPWYLQLKNENKSIGLGHTGETQIKPEQSSSKSVCIIGGGIAACCSARALAEAGYRVTLIERHSKLAQEGSGNPQGVLYAKLSHRAETLSQFNLHSLLYAQRFYRQYLAQGQLQANFCGVIQLAQNDKQLNQQQQLIEYLKAFGDTRELVQIATAETLSQKAGIDIDKAGLWFPAAGWLNPASACEALCEHANISLQYEKEIDSIERTDERWLCSDKNRNRIHSSEILVIANANEAKRFVQTSNLPLKPVRGQVSYLSATKHSHTLKAVVCGKGYIAPAESGQHCLGASFNLKEQGLELSMQEQQSNFQHLRDDCPSLFDALKLSTTPPDQKPELPLQGRVALRCTSPDYLPIVGPVPNSAGMKKTFALLARNAKASIAQAGEYHPELYVSVAYGSRGLCYAPLAAAELVSQINGAPSPLGYNLRKALNPARFMIRDIIRSKFSEDGSA